ncbi:MAG TPA: zinc ribbon domain-containing protein [Baekduia sp.]
MKGPLRRISLRRRPAEPGPLESQPTMVAPPQAPPAEPLPAGLAPEDVAPTRASFRDRGRLRRRLRYLRSVRELGFRDLGGLAFDLHRFQRRNDDLVLGKLAALDAVDRELRAIERVLDERRDIIELREPGVAACPRCGALHGSDARFCPQCGTQFSGPLAMVEVGGVATPAPEAAPTAHETTTMSPETLGATPVSGALEGNAPAEAPPEPVSDGEQSASDAPTTIGEAAAPEGTGTAPATPSSTAGEPGASSPLPGHGDTPPSGADAPTQAFQALGDDVPRHGEGNGSSSVTSGDPLAQREPKDA